MSIAVILLMTVLSFAFVVYPFFRRRPLSTDLTLEGTDNLEKNAVISEDIETLVQELRRSKGREANQPEEKSARMSCAQCGEKVTENDRFCASCGARLGGEDNGD